MMEHDLGQELGRVLLLRSQGPLDGAEPEPERVAARMETLGARILLLDATFAPYADSNGLRWLLRLREVIEKKGRCLRIVARRGSKVWRNLALLGIDLEIYASLRTAWRSPCLPGNGSGHDPGGKKRPQKGPYT